MAKIKFRDCVVIIIILISLFFYKIPIVLAVTDTQAPTAPKGLHATNKTYRSISLVWTASKDNIKVRGYQVFRDGKKIVTIIKPGYTNTDLIPGRAYTYSIKAYDATGNLSNSSGSISVSTLIDTQPPSAPLNLSVSSTDYTTITLKWNPSTDNTGLKGYEIFCNYKKTASTTSTTYICKMLTPGMAYTFTVRAYDIANNYSAQSNTIVSSTIPDTESPSIPTALKSTLVTETSVSLVWLPSRDNVKAQGYEVYCDGKKVATTSKAYYSYKKLIPGMSYMFSVKALDAVGNASISSSLLKVTSLNDVQFPTAPSNLVIKSQTQSSVSLAWDPSTDNIKVKGYRIYCNALEIATVTTTHYTVKCPKGLGIYVIWVKSFDLVNNSSGKSNSVTFIKV